MEMTDVTMKRITVEGTPAERPECLSLKAQIGWEYFFGQEGGTCFHLCDGTWLVLNKDLDIDTAKVFVNDESFAGFLKIVVDEKMEEEGELDFFSRFVTVPDLMTGELALAMRQVID